MVYPSQAFFIRPSPLLKKGKDLRLSLFILTEHKKINPPQRAVST